MVAHRKITTAARRKIAELHAQGMSHAKISQRLGDELGVHVTGRAVCGVIKGLASSAATGAPARLGSEDGAQAVSDSSAPPEAAQAPALPDPPEGAPLTASEAADGLRLLDLVERPRRLHMLARRAFADTLRRQTGRTELHDPTLVDQMLARFPGGPPPEALAAAGALRMVIQTLCRITPEAESATLIKSLSEQLSRNLDVLVSLIPKAVVDPAQDPVMLSLRDAVREQLMSYVEPARAKYGVRS